MSSENFRELIGVFFGDAIPSVPIARYIIGLRSRGILSDDTLRDPQTLAGKILLELSKEKTVVYEPELVHMMCEVIEELLALGFNSKTVLDMVIVQCFDVLKTQGIVKDKTNVEDLSTLTYSNNR